MFFDKMKIAGMGLCASFLALLLAVAYLPGFFPVGFEGLRQSRLIYLVPVVTVTGIGSAISWLYLKHKADEHA